MQMSIVSGRDEDPLSTHPAFFLVVWLGVLGIIFGVSGKVVWHEQAYIPTKTVTGLMFTERVKEKDLFAGEQGSPDSSIVFASTQEQEGERFDQTFEYEVQSLVSGYPIEAMAPYIAKQDRNVAAFLVGIAKKESDWGRHVPTKNGRDCFNYWGYKGAGSLGNSMGYGCFSDPEEAVAVVGARLYTLVVEKKNTTPSDMVIWKCGSRSCTGHEPGSVIQWIRDVDAYYSKLVAMAE